jgi:DNA topoisomerase-1
MYIIRNQKVYTIDGKHVSSKHIIDQIKKIYVPPAYKQVVYYLKKDLLAVGIDKKGRKQYIYSQVHKNSRHSKRTKTVSKVNDCIQKILSTITRDLSFSSDVNIRQCAAVVMIILLCNFRIGTESYAKEYKHYGITTLQPKHLKFTPTKLHINFVGKKGIQNSSSIQNRKLIKFIKNLCHKNKNTNRVFNVSSSNVNDYLNQFNGITCKELRTWNANKIYIDLLLQHHKQQKTKEILKNVAQQLHNTPTVCKNSYLLKGILDEPCVQKILRNKTKSVFQIITLITMSSYHA